MKIGLLGGSFNPIHLGHIAIAKTVLKKTNLDKIWFLPTGNHPLKNNLDLLALPKRIKLIKKAISDYPNFEISEYDTEPEKPSYTSELTKRLSMLHSKDKFYFIAGYDIIQELPRWHNFKWLINNVNFIIVNRPDYETGKYPNLDYINKLKFVEMEPIAVSSTQIRKFVKNGRSIANLVPENIVSDVIKYYLKMKNGKQ